MRRFATVLLTSLSALGLFAASASAAAPTLGPVSATDTQGVSALLKGTVNPQGEATSYWFEYGTASNFAGAIRTPASSAGSGSSAEAARAAISGLAPDTTYHYRLIARNASGTTTGTVGAGTAAGFRTTEGFGIAGFSAKAIADGGEAATLAGSHPYQLSLDIALREGGEFEDQPGATFPDGDIRDLRIEMPQGLIVNPSITPVCTREQFHTPRISPFAPSRSGESCPDWSQLGTAKVATGSGERTFGVFNLTAPPGVPAQFGLAPFGAPIVIDVGLAPNPDGTYTLSLEAEDIPQALDLHDLELDLWGTPWAASHNGQRGNCLNETEPTFSWAKCSVGEPSLFRPLAFLSLPPLCSGTLAFDLTANSWQQPAQVAASEVNRGSGGTPAPMSCGFAQFTPQAVAHLDNIRASSPSGFVFRLDTSHYNLTAPNLVNPTPPRTAIVTLPDGATINPSVGAGLGVCTPAQFAAEGVFTTEGAACPNAAKIGTLSARTPLFADALTGPVYLAQPDDPATSAPGAENPFDNLLAVYMLAKSPQRGVMIKLAGKLTPNPINGTLTATFDGLPQIPYANLEISFRSGQRSFLITPPRCGYVGTGVHMIPWGRAASDLDVTSYTLIKTGIGDGPCPSGTPPFNPTVAAGGVNSNVNSYTPYFIHISRGDNEQEITSYSLKLPKGVTGKLAGIPFCPDAAIEAAKHRRGFAEAASPSCPSASQVGRTFTGYGVGSALTYTPGKVYLAGPHNGAPLSLVTINPAIVGPFDLGTVVIRSAFTVDERTAQLELDSSASDPIPHIRDGVVLHLRDIRIYMDRYEFTHNPSSCAPSQMVSTVRGSGAAFDNPADDSTSVSSVHFQLLNCRILGFKPQLGVRLRGTARRGGYPSLRATFAARGNRDSNLKEIAVVIPRQQFLAQNHIRGVCTRAQFAERRCPANSIYGSAVAHTPLFDEPLRGNVYLRSSSQFIPDLVADLYSGAVRIVLEGRIGPSKQGGIRTFFSDLPDDPVNFFRMTLFGGRRGLLQNSANICKQPPISNVKAIAQNNIGAVFTTRLRGQSCGKKTKKKRKRRGHTRKQGGKASAVASARRSG
jgi:hypothetical protein